MKYCTNCGTPLADDATFCPQCQPAGNAPQQEEINAPQYQQVQYSQPQYQYQQTAYQQPQYQQAQYQQVQYQQNPYPQAQYPQQAASNGMQTACKVLMIISTVVMGLYLIPLAWCIPMTVSYSNKIKTGQPISTGFKVCTLLFVNTIAGILMLVDKD